jgi:hypothetical protein
MSEIELSQKSEAQVEKRGRGRPPLKDLEDTLDITFKVPKSIFDQLNYYVDLINSKKGFSVTRSELIRSLVQYRISNAPQIYKETIFRDETL